MDISVWSILCNNLDINLDEQDDHKCCHFGNLKGRVGDGGDEAGSKLENDILKLIDNQHGQCQHYHQRHHHILLAVVYLAEEEDCCIGKAELLQKTHSPLRFELKWISQNI